MSRLLCCSPTMTTATSLVNGALERLTRSRAGRLSALTSDDHFIVGWLTFSETVDNRWTIVTLRSILSAVCIAHNCYMADSLLML